MPHDRFQACIEACNESAVACDHCAASCLQEQDVKMVARCIALDTDCADICRLAAAYMSRGSELAGALCEICAEVCEACAKECGVRATQDGALPGCAEACRRCAEECRCVAATQPRSQPQAQGAQASAH